MKTTFFETARGHVYRSPEGRSEVALNPRSAVFSDGEVACSFMLQSGFGMNDFKAMLAFSQDSGSSWSEPILLWRHLLDRFSFVGQISSIPGTDSLLFFGTRIPIDVPGELYWHDGFKGIKQNELIWARSDDRGQTWADPQGIGMPRVGSAEAQGPILVMRNGVWVACYAPYRTWNPDLKVELNCLMQLRSENEGESWEFSRVMTFIEPQSGAAEAWIAELTDEVLISTCWHTNLSDQGEDFTNKYALSPDGGRSWSGPHDTSIQGQSTALLALNSREVLMVYNQRKRGEPGIRAAKWIVDESGATLVCDDYLWKSEIGTRNRSSGNHADWTDFAFGEPALARVNEDRLLLVFWEKGESGASSISFRLYEERV